MTPEGGGPEPEGVRAAAAQRAVSPGGGARDRGWFEAHLGEDFLCSLPDGTILDRAGFLAQLRPGAGPVEIEAHDVLVRVLGDVALVHARTTFLLDGRPRRGRYTDVWALRDGRWRAVAAHVTRL